MLLLLPNRSPLEEEETKAAGALLLYRCNVVGLRLLLEAGTTL